jgi:hypothetical protein
MPSRLGTVRAGLILALTLIVVLYFSRPSRDESHIHLPPAVIMLEEHAFSPVSEAELRPMTTDVVQFRGTLYSDCDYCRILAVISTRAQLSLFKFIHCDSGIPLVVRELRPLGGNPPAVLLLHGASFTSQVWVSKTGLTNLNY